MDDDAFKQPRLLNWLKTLCVTLRPKPACRSWGWDQFSGLGFFRLGAKVSSRQTSRDHKE